MTDLQLWLVLIVFAVLAFGWLGFVAWIRMQDLRDRREVRRDKASRRGASLGGYVDDDRAPMEDSAEAMREEYARLKSRLERQYREAP